MRCWRVILSLLALSACEAKPPESESDKLTRLISEQLGRQVELHYVETEPAGTKATCGYAGDPVTTRRPDANVPPPLNDVLFIYEARKLTVSEGPIVPPDTLALVRQRCPSLTINPTPMVSVIATDPIRA